MDQVFYISFFSTLFGTLALLLIARRNFVIVEPGQSALVVTWGKCREVISEAGFYFRPYIWMPGCHVIRVSRQLDYERLADLHINDADGTTLRVDIWLEHKVVDPQKSVFSVESWPTALRNLVVHVAMEKMGHAKLDSLLTNRDGIANEILSEVRSEALSWGIQIESLIVQDIRLLPEISKQFFDRVAAQLELKKSRIEEMGRVAVHTLQAETEVRISELQAQAKAMHPLAVGRAYQQMATNHEVLKGFQELHQLSLMQPGKLISFVGFEKSEISALDVMMMPDGSETKQSVTRSTTMAPH